MQTTTTNQKAGYSITRLGLLVTALTACFPMGAAFGARTTTPACSQWTYVAGTVPLLDANDPSDGRITVGDVTISIGDICPPVPAKIRTSRRGTSVRARWESCANLAGPVRFQAKIDAGCQVMRNAKLNTNQGKKTFTATAVSTASGLRPRAIFRKPVVTRIDTSTHSARQVVVKFHEGTHVRFREGHFIVDALTDVDRQRLRRNVLTEAEIGADVEEANRALDRPGVSVVGLFEVSENEPSERAVLEADAREELADLRLYFTIALDASDAAVAENLVNRLNALRSVETSYPEPMPAVPAADIAPPTTIDLVPSQGYLRAAFKNGIDADWAGRLPGGRGADIRVIDVEEGWIDGHEDLPGSYFFKRGLNVAPFNIASGHHGTAVLGVLGAGDNGYGATGIVPDASLGWSSVWRPTLLDLHSTAAAVDNAAAALRSGDVIIIEQHYPALPIPAGATCDATCSVCGTSLPDRQNGSQFGYFPAEAVPAVFDVVRRATAKGIVVVEAAGNGQMNLDDASFGGRFDRTVRDSGAIMVGAGGTVHVGAGGTVDRVAECFTNFGSRVDVQGWGRGVATTGYGDGCPDPQQCASDASLRANGDDTRQFYTLEFNGTSSASPIVAGAAVAVNGSRRADGDPPLNSVTMRALLRATGTSQPAIDAATRQIGPLPDLRKALPAVAGRVDEIRSDGVVRGWAFHAAQPATSVGVHFFIDGPSDAGRFGGNTIANVSRPDVNGYFAISGLHGFEFSIPDAFRDGATHTLFAVGIDPTSAQRNRQLQQVLTFNLRRSTNQELSPCETIPLTRRYSPALNRHWIVMSFFGAGCDDVDPWICADYPTYEGSLGTISTVRTSITASLLYSCYRATVSGLGDIDIESFVSQDPGCEGHYSVGSLGYPFASVPSAWANVKPLYRCNTGHSHFVSNDENCEGYTREVFLGYALAGFPAGCLN